MRTLTIVMVAALAAGTAFADGAKWTSECVLNRLDGAYVPVNCIQRTMKALAESTPENLAEVRIAFYGQSIDLQLVHAVLKLGHAALDGPRRE